MFFLFLFLIDKDIFMSNSWSEDLLLFTVALEPNFVIIMATTFWPFYPPAFFRSLLSSVKELRTEPFILPTGIHSSPCACFEDI